MTFLRLNNVSAYKKSFSLSNYVWEVVNKWSSFAKNTVGSQFVRAVDSVSANIAEGFGRHSTKEKVNHYRIARGSVLESLDWNEKAKKRKLITQKEYDYILNELLSLPREINNLIGFTRKKLKE